MVLSRLLTSFKLRRLEPGHFAYAMLLGGIGGTAKMVVWNCSLDFKSLQVCGARVKRPFRFFIAL